MNWKNRLTNYNFWVSIVSAVLLIFQAFNLKFDIIYINEIATAVLGLLVVIGIISDPTKTAVKTSSKVVETTEEKKEELVDKVVENKEEAKEDVKEEAETVMPIAEEIENGNVFTQDDFKILIEKISQDLHNLTMQKEEAKVEETKEIVPTITEEIKTEEVKETQIYNIVN